MPDRRGYFRVVNDLLGYLTALAAGCVLFWSLLVLRTAVAVSRFARYQPVRWRVAPVLYLLGAGCALVALLSAVSENAQFWLTFIGACLSVGATFIHMALDGAYAQPRNLARRFGFAIPGLYWFEDHGNLRAALSKRKEIQLVAFAEPDRLGDFHGRAAREVDEDGRPSVLFLQDCEIDEDDEFSGEDELSVIVAAEVILTCRFGEHEYSAPLSLN